MNAIRVQTDDFDVSTESHALVRNAADVPVVTFTGCVRGDDSLAALTIEHYPGMTEREIAKHVSEAQTRWPILGATVIHRIGRLKPGEQSCSSPSAPHIASPRSVPRSFL